MRATVPNAPKEKKIHFKYYEDHGHELLITSDYEVNAGPPKHIDSVVFIDTEQIHHHKSDSNEHAYQG